ncbi:MAG: FAD-binding protein [Deltaproteobacteria bacterium]|nr:FAD-binding protein [Deltaproteobacteria bacterium]
MAARVVVVGAGPGGLFSSHLLGRAGLDVTLLDMGDDLEERLAKLGDARPGAGPNYVQGMGGSGTFSDGKLNLNPEIGGNMLEFVSRGDADRLIEHVDSVFIAHGADREDAPSPRARELARRAMRAGIKYVPIRQKHIGSDRLPKLVAGLRAELQGCGVRIRVRTKAEDLVLDADAVRGVVVEADGGRQTLDADYVVLAPGRAGSRWLLDLACRYGIPYGYGPLDIGVRVEVPNEVMEDVTAVNRDPKFHVRTRKYDDFVRTFCTNPGGYVITEDYGRFVSVNGHGMKDRTSDNTNFALLVRLHLTEPVENTTLYGESLCHLAHTIGGGKPILQRMGDLAKGRRSTWERLEKSYVAPTNPDVTPGDIGMALPYRVVEDLVEGLTLLAKVIPGVDEPSTLLYAPEIKFKSVRMDMTPTMETRQVAGLFAVGDGAGVSGGIVTAAVTGLIAAREILRREGLACELS